MGRRRRRKRVSKDLLDAADVAAFCERDHRARGDVFDDIDVPARPPDLETVDFLRGAEEYKYAWGAKDRINKRRQFFRG